MTLPQEDVLLLLRRRLTGSLVHSCDGYWDVSRAAWVSYVRSRPCAVVQAVSAADITATVDFAREHGLQVVERRAGAPPVRSRAGTLVLDTSRVSAAPLGLRAVEQRQGAEDSVRDPHPVP